MTNTFKTGDIIHDRDEYGVFGEEYGVVTFHDDIDQVWATWFYKDTKEQRWPEPCHVDAEDCEIYAGPTHLSPRGNNEVQDAIDTLCKHGYTMSLSLTKKD